VLIVVYAGELEAHQGLSWLAAFVAEIGDEELHGA
jgi:hypothetical protein